MNKITELSGDIRFVSYSAVGGPRWDEYHLI